MNRQDSLSNTERSQILRVIVEMLVSLRERSSEPEVVAAGYVFAAEGIPADVIRVAAGRFIRGQVEGQSLDFPPNTARFRAECDRLMAAAREHERLTRPALPAPPERQISEDKRKLIAAGLAALASELRRDEEQEEARRERWRKQGAEAQRNLDERARAHGGDVASAALRKRVREMIREAAE